MRRGSEHIAGLAGLLSVALGLIGTLCLPIWDFPSTGASNVAVLDFLHGHRAAMEVEALLDAGVATLWLVFGCGVWQRVRDARSMVPACFVAGVVAMSSLLLAGFTVVAVLMYHLPHDEDLARVLYDLGFGMLAMSGLPTAVALAAFAIFAHRSAPVPALLGWLAAVTAVVHVLFLATFMVPNGVLSLEGPMITIAPILFFLWVAITSGWLLAWHTRASAAGVPVRVAP